MIYLDSAATSLYKPACVGRAAAEAMKRFASPGRGVYSSAMAAADCCFECRERLAKLFHVPAPEQVVFTFNATHGLNIAIRSLVKPGGRVLISGYEHNAVTRPLHALGARLDVIATPLFEAEAFLKTAEARMEGADTVICTHVSNVFGYVLPLERLAELCRRKQKPLIVDASQSAGLLPLDFSALDAAFIAMPGHKALMGPQGTGVLLCGAAAEPLIYGGSGSESRRTDMPETLPDRLEAGTLNVAGIAGLSAAVDYLLQNGIAAVSAAERERLERFAEGLAGLEGLQVFFTPAPGRQSGVLSVLPREMDCEAFAAALDAEGVAIRSGLHCAPLAHKTAGTLSTGTARFSFSPFNTSRQLAQALSAVKRILKKD